MSFILYISQESSDKIDVSPTLSKACNKPCFHIQSNNNNKKKRKNKCDPKNPSHSKLDNFGEVQCCVPMSVGNVFSVIKQPHSKDIKMQLLLPTHEREKPAWRPLVLWQKAVQLELGGR